MYCSQCGAQVSGNFCSVCGTPLKDTTANKEQIDWFNEIQYEKLIRITEVRDLIARHAAQSKKKMSAEEFLKNYDATLEPLGSIVQPISAKLGIKTGKTQNQVFNYPSGRILVALLCSMARHGWQLHNVKQAKDECTLIASIPSDMWSVEGDLIVTVRPQGSDTLVEAEIIIKGQLFDWGKSRNCINELFGDLEAIPA